VGNVEGAERWKIENSIDAGALLNEKNQAIYLAYGA
jgi:hypothetical protein